jgi:hypothetical protein
LHQATQRKFPEHAKPAEHEVCMQLFQHTHTSIFFVLLPAIPSSVDVLFAYMCELENFVLESTVIALQVAA